MSTVRFRRFRRLMHGVSVVRVTDDPSLLRMRRDAVLLGYSDGELARLARSGAWARLRRGAYVEGVLPSPVAERHRMLMNATVSGLRRPAVVSHQSAAVLHGFPLGTSAPGTER